MADQVPNMTNKSVKVGRSYVSDGALKTPTLHVNAKVQITYMNDAMRKGLGGVTKKFSGKEYTGQEAKRRREVEMKRKAKEERMRLTGRMTIVRKGPTVKSAAGRGKNPLVLECSALNASGLKAGGSGYAPPDYAVPMQGINKPVVFDEQNAKVDEQLLKGRRPVKKKVVKIVHGVPVYFRDDRAAMSASEIRAMKTRQKTIRMSTRLSSREGGPRSRGEGQEEEGEGGEEDGDFGAF
jgi:hypothetical protein